MMTLRFDSFANHQPLQRGLKPLHVVVRFRASRSLCTHLSRFAENEFASLFSTLVYTFRPPFPKHSVGWTDIEMKNQADPCQVLHMLERPGYHVRRVVPSVNLARFF